MKVRSRESELFSSYASFCNVRYKCCQLHFLSIQFMFDGQPGDIVGCTADLGWMAGHTCVYGPLCNGEATVLFEGLPWDPDPGMFDHRYCIII